MHFCDRAHLSQLSAQKKGRFVCEENPNKSSHGAADRRVEKGAFLTCRGSPQSWVGTYNWPPCGWHWRTRACGWGRRWRWVGRSRQVRWRWTEIWRSSAQWAACRGWLSYARSGHLGERSNDETPASWTPLWKVSVPITVGGQRSQLLSTFSQYGLALCAEYLSPF